MKHVVTFYELRSEEFEFRIVSSCEGEQYKEIYLKLRNGEIKWVVMHEMGGYVTHLSNHSCLNDAIDRYNEI